jgi:hypothetical protein
VEQILRKTTKENLGAKKYQNDHQFGEKKSIIVLSCFYFSTVLCFFRLICDYNFYFIAML